MEKYKFRRYDKNFPSLYLKEFTCLKKILPKTAKMEHIGSSAVEGLRGKGLIDIAIAVPKRSIGSARAMLEKGGYELRPAAGTDDRLFFRRDYVSKGRKRRVHLHLTHQGSNDFIEMVAVRDYLRANKTEARKYEAVKRKAVKAARGNGTIYKRLKKRYLDGLTKRAISKYGLAKSKS